MANLSVSLVCTVLNEAGGLQELLRSFKAQTRQPDEIVVVDGGSIDGTREALEASCREHPALHVLARSGANIARGRNEAIRAASGEIVAVTDAGVRLDAHWLAALLEPFERCCPPPDVVCGFFEADPRSLFELVLGATTLPTVDEIDPATFLPSSRSVAFRRSAWVRVGGYPEWLDYCEDLVFDIALRRAGLRFAWAPTAIAGFRPRPDLRHFFVQYYRYARGDGKALLWGRRHAIRYLTYLGAAALLTVSRLHPLALALLMLAAEIYCGRPFARLWPRLAGLSPAARLHAIALIPFIRLTGDVAKMLGYPVGLLWRARARSC
jgi:glycosyltransferase involved in cell wall biosynthesis